MNWEVPKYIFKKKKTVAYRTYSAICNKQYTSVPFLHYESQL